MKKKKKCIHIKNNIQREIFPTDSHGIRMIKGYRYQPLCLCLFLFHIASLCMYRYTYSSRISHADSSSQVNIDVGPARSMIISTPESSAKIKKKIICIYIYYRLVQHPLAAL